MAKSAFRPAAVGLGVAAIVIAVVLARRGSDKPAAPPPADTQVAEPAPPAPPPAAPAVVLDAAPAVAAPKPAAHAAAAVTKLGEPQLMTRLRDLKEKDPTTAVELAREGNHRFPDSADAPERASILIHALAALDRPSEARGEAEDMVNHYPDSNWVREVEQFIGAHRRRSVRVNDAGELIAQ